MSERYEKLKGLLKELFQLDQPDLDFGLYRIMHVKSAEVTQFLDRDLLPQVKAEFGKYKTADKSEIEKELSKAIEAAQGLGVDPESTQKVKDLRAKLTDTAVDISALESEVYDHLFGFFRRYYSEGDFLSKRVYKPGVYAIPYEGEEVKLHWANADQYYIKTSEYLRGYAFRLRPDDEAKPMRVHFRLSDAVEAEHGNAKATEGKDRVFVLTSQDLIAKEEGEQGDELIIHFEFRPATLADWPENIRAGKKNPPTQKDLIAFACDCICAAVNYPLEDWITELKKLSPTSSDPDRTVLRKHLKKYADINKFDYFIHKDLGVFLHRELDFYIKNEVMHLDDVEDNTVARVEQYLSKIKVIRRIAGKLIDFLSQLEDFQKKLWLKKKLVVETQYCITVGNIPDSFYAEIAANEAQIEEWIRLFSIDEYEGDQTTPRFTRPLTVDFLKGFPTLVVDSKYFESDFVARLLDAIEHVDQQIDGVLIHGDNFQSLSLMHTKYAEQVKCIYIDPPYNTGDDGFPYRDSYQHSSWISMMDDRLEISRRLLKQDGLLACHMDEHEHMALEYLIQKVFGQQGDMGKLIWDKRNPKGDATGIAAQHEYLHFAARDPSTLKAEDAFVRNKKNAAMMLDKARDLIRRNGGNVSSRVRQEFKAWMDTQTLSGGEKAYNLIDDNGDVYRPVSMAWPNKKKAPDDYFIPMIHPETGQPCPVPNRGWRNPSETMKRLLNAGLILFGDDHTTVPNRKYLLRDNMTETMASLFYFGGSDDELHAAMGLGRFENPKPTEVALYFLEAMARPKDSWILDFFAGSGTTGHATLRLNRNDGGRRKFILVEMGDYFDTVLLQRIKKVSFSPEWRDGKPSRFANPVEVERSPRIIKIIRLESYEDALNNLVTPRRTSAQQLLLDTPQALGADGFKEQYLLSYMLNVETSGSQSLLNVQAFADPTAYRLKVKRPGSDESCEMNVDLLETFNWLIGLTVQHIAAPQSFAAAFDRDAEKRLQLKGRLKLDDKGRWWFRRVEGQTPDGRKALVVWRKLTGEVEQDNLVLDVWMKDKLKISTQDFEYDLIYVNGTNNLENLRTPDDTWKVRLIEEDFHRLMFDTEGA